MTQTAPTDMPAMPAAARTAPATISVQDFLRHLHSHGRLMPQLRAAAVERELLNAAAEMGLTVSTDELQRAADRFRGRSGLHAAADMQRWLDTQRLSADDFETILEHQILIAKLKDLLTSPRLAAHFAANRNAYAQASIRQIVVRTEDLARELLQQVQDEG